MRIEWRDERRRKIGRVEVDPAPAPAPPPAQAPLATRPTRAPIIERGVHDPQREAFLQWEGALDDAGQLRKCLACGCPDLFKEKAFPQVTGLVIVLAFVGAIVGGLGLATNLPVLLLLIVVLVLDVAILVLSHRRLVCYRCRSSYHDVAIARYHRAWDRATADRYPAPPKVVDVVTAREAASPAPAAPTDAQLTPAIAGSASAADLPLKEKNYFT